jgi:hypothetical protein
VFAGTVRALNELELAERCALVGHVLSLIVFVAEALPCLIGVPCNKYVNVYDDAVRRDAGKQKSFVIPDSVPKVMDCENANVRYSSAAAAPLGKLMPNTVEAKLLLPTAVLSVPAVVSVVPGRDRLATVNPDAPGGVGITAGLAGTEPRLLKGVWKVKLDARVACGVAVGAELGHESTSRLTACCPFAPASTMMLQLTGPDVKNADLPDVLVGAKGPTAKAKRLG